LRLASWQSWTLGLAGHWEMPAAANSHEPEPEAEKRATDCHRGRGKPERGADYHNGRAS
jgi:hypothetical protein